MLLYRSRDRNHCDYEKTNHESDQNHGGDEKMNLYQNNQYLDDVRYVADLKLPWEKLSNKTIMISGATGLVGSLLVDVLMEKNRSEDLGCTVYALGRNEQKAKKRFSKYTDTDYIY